MIVYLIPVVTTADVLRELMVQLGLIASVPILGEETCVYWIPEDVL